MLFRRGISCLITAVLVCTLVARAVIIEAPTTWTGLGPNPLWTTASNWQLNTPPSTDGTAQIRFGLSNRSEVLVDANQNVKGLTFDFSTYVGYGYYTLLGNTTSGRTLTLGAGGLTTIGGATSTAALTSAATTSTSATTTSAYSYNFGSVYLDSSLGLVLGADQIWSVASSTSLDVSGVISGAGKLTLRGDGYLTLDGNNTYTGGTVLESVDLWVGSNTALGSGAVTVTGNSTLINGTDGDLTLANAFTLTGSALDFFSDTGLMKLTGAITLAANTAIANDGETLYLDGNIGETGGSRMLTFDGSGVAVLSGQNTYTGGTAVYDGGVIFRNGQAVPATGSLTSDLYGYIGIAFATGTQTGFLGKFDKTATYGAIGFDTDPSATNATTFAEPITLTGFNSYVRLGSATRAIMTGTITPAAGAGYRFGGGGGTLTVQSKLTGANNLLVESLPGGELTLKVAVAVDTAATGTPPLWTNDYTGTTEATNSAIIFGPGALSTASATGSFRLNNGGYIGSEDATPDTFLPKFAPTTLTGVIGFDSTDINNPRVILGDIDLRRIDGDGGAVGTFSTGRSIAIGTATAAKISGNITLPAGQTDYYFTGYKGGFLEVNSTLRDARAVHLGDFWGEYPDFDPNDDLRMSTVFLNAANTHTGGTQLHSGRLVLGNIAALGTGALTISHNYHQDSVPRLETSMGNTPVFGNNLTIENDFEVGGVNSYTLAGKLSDGANGSGTLRKFGNFNLTLSGDNAAFSGGFHIAAGTLTFVGNTAAGAGHNWLGFGYEGGSGIASFVASTSGSATPAIGGLESYSDTAKIQLGNGVTLKINQSFDGTFAGRIEGQGAILKTSAGSLYLTKANTYSGGTLIAEGAIGYGATGALGTGSVTLNGPAARLMVEHGATLSNAVVFGTGGGVLSGNGTFGSNVVLTANSGIAPGHSVGSLVFSAGLTWNGGSYYNVEFQDMVGGSGIGHDTIAVTGALVFNASAASPFTLNLSSLTSAGASGNLANFVATNAYSWQIATTTGGILGFDPAAFAINTSGFANAIGIGTFSVALSGNNLLLNFTPVPEPSTWALMIGGLCAVALTALRRRRR